MQTQQLIENVLNRVVTNLKNRAVYEIVHVPIRGISFYRVKHPKCPPIFIKDGEDEPSIERQIRLIESSVSSIASSSASGSTPSDTHQSGNVLTSHPSLRMPVSTWLLSNLGKILSLIMGAVISFFAFAFPLFLNHIELVAKNEALEVTRETQLDHESRIKALEVPVETQSLKLKLQNLQNHVAVLNTKIKDLEKKQIAQPITTQSAQTPLAKSQKKEFNWFFLSPCFFNQNLAPATTLQTATDPAPSAH